VSSAPPGMSDKRILLVDDSKFVRTTFKGILGQSFTVVEAADGEAGWQAIQADKHIRLVFSDLDMPKLDGYGLLARVRKSTESRIRDLPVVIISGAEDEKAKQRARAAGANDFISKSAEGTEILARIENLMKLADTTQNLKRTELDAQRKATHDPLTGAFTLHYVVTEGRKHFSHVRRHGGQFSIMVFGIDNHAELAAAMGKESANELLKRIAKLVTSSMRTEDSLGRTGDAVFTLLSLGTGAPQALAFARRLREILEGANIKHAGKVLALRASFGVASLALDPAPTFEDLMKRAVERMRKREPRPEPAAAAAPAAALAAAPSAVPAPAAKAPPALPPELERALQVLETSGARAGEASGLLIRRLQRILEALKLPAKTS